MSWSFYTASAKHYNVWGDTARVESTSYHAQTCVNVLTAPIVSKYATQHCEHADIALINVIWFKFILSGVVNSFTLHLVILADALNQSDLQ